MNKKTMGILCIGAVFLLLQMTPVFANQNEDTTLEIVGISSTFGGVIVDVKNTGGAVATKITMSTTITGGILNNVDLTHVCGGCSDCGTTLGPNEIKTENTLEVGLLFGFGPIQISSEADASNANRVTAEATGFLIGPIVIIQ